MFSDGMSKVRRLSWMFSCQNRHRLRGTLQPCAAAARTRSLGRVLGKAASKLDGGRDAGGGSGCETWIGLACSCGNSSLFSAGAGSSGPLLEQNPLSGRAHQTRRRPAAPRRARCRRRPWSGKTRFACTARFIERPAQACPSLPKPAQARPGKSRPACRQSGFPWKSRFSPPLLKPKKVATFQSSALEC